ncbi:Diphthamide biosynthesis protein 2, partial [Linderina macrospora]
MSNELTAPAPIDDDGSTVIQREAVISEKHAETADEVERIYEVERTASVIASGSYTKIALQFPDELLADSTAVAHALTERTGAKIFILADTSYGSCCVDEVASEHYSADLIVHYGRTCLSLTTRVPVFYVFGKEPVDVDDLVAEAEKQIEGRRVLLMYDVPYAYIASEITQRLGETGRFESVTCSTISVADRPYVPAKPANTVSAKPKKDCDTNCCGGCDKKSEAGNEDDKAAAVAGAEPTPDIKAGRAFELEPDTVIGDYTILYIGGESPTLTNIMLTQRCQAVFSYDPRASTMREETYKVNKHLNRRYFMVQKAKDADVIGIVVGTLAATRYLSVVESLKAMIRRAHKKFYVFVVGKLNVPKLANFAEIEVFVL